MRWMWRFCTRGTAGSASGHFRSAAAVIVAMCTEAMTAGRKREGSGGGKRQPGIARPRQDAKTTRATSASTVSGAAA